ncbi:hypothetical protein M4L90_02750 [Staphylococcus equorum]|uniref:Uncharacterized protein n=1 Tax=Staphylococcus equorum TaxID=246432 RepID=A0A9X4QXK7_9STAP|nr:hypothetical protein [Staphylococcus equorum]MDG0818808.1 hypothetical protein [Staphylococcus equorum]MDG0839449.1 hypothetical protein [Staphylococcus equorum]MDG0844825.1 hypothetical protein [Staphylococcus equorum]
MQSHKSNFLYKGFKFNKNIELTGKGVAFMLTPLSENEIIFQEMIESEHELEFVVNESLRYLDDWIATNTNEHERVFAKLTHSN